MFPKSSEVHFRHLLIELFRQEVNVGTCAKTEHHVCSSACQAAQKKRSVQGPQPFNIRIKGARETKNVTPQDTCRTPSAQPKKPDRQEATHECPEECATRHFLIELFWQGTEIVVVRRTQPDQLRRMPPTRNRNRSTGRQSDQPTWVTILLSICEAEMER